MALTTRCPHCGTAFKVVPDQLRIRNGLVRCGACSTVFDGRASLVQPADVPGRQAEMPVAMPAATAAGPPSRPMRFLPWFGPRLRLPGLPSRCRRGKTSLLSRNPRRGLGRSRHPRRRPPCCAAANRSAGRRRTRTRAPTSWMTMSCWTMSCMMTNRRTMNHGAVVVTARTGMMMRAAGATVLMSAIRTRVPRRHDSRSVAARRS